MNRILAALAMTTALASTPAFANHVEHDETVKLCFITEYGFRAGLRNTLETNIPAAKAIAISMVDQDLRIAIDNWRRHPRGADRPLSELSNESYQSIELECFEKETGELLVHSKFRTIITLENGIPCGRSSWDGTAIHPNEGEDELCNFYKIEETDLRFEEE